jgi:predicted RNase H-like HicB family nuclease
MKNSDKSASLYLSALKGQPFKMYGNGADDETVDDLTNYASKDFVEGGLSQDELFKEAAEKCQARPELSECEGIISNGESFEKAKHAVEQEMTLRREVEMARIRELKKNPESLEKYLEENGYADILDQFKKGKLNEAGIEEKVGQAFEAKKIALLQQMNAKLGKRQVSVNSNNPNTQLTKSEVDAVVQETKEERARLAQVVLFNNIITGHLELKKEDGSTVGRNVNVWKKEEKGLESSQVNSNLFQNIKSSNADAQGLSREDKISGFQIIDSLLGKPDK